MNDFERFGWIMFALSGVFFLALGVRERDLLTVGGALVWMLGCAAFLLSPKQNTDVPESAEITTQLESLN